MLHDEDDYPGPSTFRPERFLKDGQLDPSVRDPAQIAFGFGRRLAVEFSLVFCCSKIYRQDMPRSTHRDLGPVAHRSEYPLNVQH